MSLRAATSASLAAGIFDAYEAWDRDFRWVTRRAAQRFADRAWRDGQRDAAARLALYRTWLDHAVQLTRRQLAARTADRGVWQLARERYAALARGRGDCEVAETFFNSVTRRVFTTVGVDPAIEFLRPHVREADADEVARCLRVVPCDDGMPAFAARVLDAGHGLPPFADAAEDTRLAGDALLAGACAAFGAPPERAELLDAVFYRNKGAYLVGRLVHGRQACPLVVALLHDAGGVRCDAVLTDEDEASIVFGFAWSYFQVETTRPRAFVTVLSAMLPQKRIDELYAAIGYHKHAKTELYRLVRGHLARPGARFLRAPGARGLVMEVFTLPSLNVVFKIIKDRFGQPKRTTRREVRERYQFVFQRDRVGRLADAQEFEHLAFRRGCFDARLLAELVEAAPGVVRVAGDEVVVRHLYTERRLVPLDIFTREMSPDDARAAIVDYGQAIKDLAVADIFTGDMLLKNFGVSRHGRVIFYDYDELAAVLDCEYRDVPTADGYGDDDFGEEPWYTASERDVFPDEFRRFLVPAGPLRDAFMDAHADLCDASWWRGVQERLRAGEVEDVYPYRADRRLRR